VKFIYQELPGDGAFMTAQLAGNDLTREDVESHFKAELAKK